MKNILIAVLFFAGTAVMAQSGSMQNAPIGNEIKNEKVAEPQAKAEMQKMLDLTDAEASRVWALQEKYCGPNVEVNLKSSGKQHEAYFAALKEVIPADKAEKLMEECKMTCSPSSAKPEAEKKGCCAGSSSKKSCSEKKK